MNTTYKNDLDSNAKTNRLKLYGERRKKENITVSGSESKNANKHSSRSHDKNQRILYYPK